MRLQDKFLAHLISLGQMSFTTGEALRWYKDNKASPGRADYTNLYHLIIFPLIGKGIVRKGCIKGLWELKPSEQNEEGSKVVDEFDLYIQQKLRGGSTDGKV